MPDRFHMPFSKVLQGVFSRTRGNIKPGAHRIQAFVPKEFLHLPTFLVGGSNGKGTTCSFLEAALRASGFRTGLYTSPHLIHPCERIRINGISISSQELEETLQKVFLSTQTVLPDATFFELTTLVAFHLFAQASIDVLVCEVGLGGLWDSTNVLSPQVSVLTSIALEHTDILGKTLFAIAKDKAYISRRNRPLVCGPLTPEAQQGVEETLRITGAQYICTQTQFPSSFLPLQKVSPNLNLKTALTALDMFGRETNTVWCLKKLEKGLQAAYWPGRCDIRKVRGRTVVLDAAHNSSGLKFFLEQQYKTLFSEPCVLMFASLKDKDIENMCLLFSEFVKHVVVTEIPHTSRAYPAHLISPYLPPKIPYTIEPCLEHALEKAFSLYPESPLVITGSIAFLGEVMSLCRLSVFV
jgi:dihydrofolate synthase / folylpolyglutamate synthase